MVKNSTRFGAAAAIGAAVGAAATAWHLARQRAEARRRIWSNVLSLEMCERIHAGSVQRIASQLRTRTARTPVSLRKKAVSHQVPKGRSLIRDDEKIDVSDLDRILHVDPERRICIAEPGVTFEDLVEATLPYGLTPIIVPELKTITIGGAVSGCSIESASFRYGGFHDTCLEYEVVTARGEVLRCTPHNENRLLFQMVHGSFGTLGILTKLVFRLVPAKPFVHLTYETCRSVEEYRATIQRHVAAGDCDFLDGIIHSPRELVLSVGRFVDHAPYANRYDWTKVYYQSTRERAEDYLRTPHYYFRYDHGVTNVHPKSYAGRLLFGKFMGSSQLLWLAEKLPWLLDDEKPTVTLDVFIPISKFETFMGWYEKTFDFFPLWCVPYRLPHKYEWLSRRFVERSSDELFVDLAIYGMEQKGGVNYHKLMEEKLLEIGGIKTLISHNYFSEDQFWQMWNRENYEAAKSVTDPERIFRDLYTKTCKAAMGVRDEGVGSAA
jgi:hypothetical protein